MNGERILKDKHLNGEKGESEYDITATYDDIELARSQLYDFIEADG